MKRKHWRTGMTMPLMLLMSGCQAWTWTPEERASHEAYEKGFTACEKLTDFMDRKHCFDEPNHPDCERYPTGTKPAAHALRRSARSA